MLVTPGSASSLPLWVRTGYSLSPVRGSVNRSALPGSIASDAQSTASELQLAIDWADPRGADPRGADPRGADPRGAGRGASATRWLTLLEDLTNGR